MTTTIATVDLKTIHEIYKLIKTDYPEHNERFLYFLATCFHLDPDVNLAIALKLRPYGDIIGKDNLPLDTYLESFKVLCLHATLPMPSDLSQRIAKRVQDTLTFCLVQSQTLTLVT